MPDSTPPAKKGIIPDPDQEGHDVYDKLLNTIERVEKETGKDHGEITNLGHHGKWQREKDGSVTITYDDDGHDKKHVEKIKRTKDGISVQVDADTGEYRWHSITTLGRDGQSHAVVDVYDDDTGEHSLGHFRTEETYTRIHNDGSIDSVKDGRDPKNGSSDHTETHVDSDGHSTSREDSWDGHGGHRVRHAHDDVWGDYEDEEKSIHADLSAQNGRVGGGYNVLKTRFQIGSQPLNASPQTTATSKASLDVNTRKSKASSANLVQQKFSV